MTHDLTADGLDIAAPVQTQLRSWSAVYIWLVKEKEISKLASKPKLEFLLVKLISTDCESMLGRVIRGTTGSERNCEPNASSTFWIAFFQTSCRALPPQSLDHRPLPEETWANQLGYRPPSSWRHRPGHSQRQPNANRSWRGWCCRATEKLEGSSHIWKSKPGALVDLNGVMATKGTSAKDSSHQCLFFGCCNKISSTIRSCPTHDHEVHSRALLEFQSSASKMFWTSHLCCRLLFFSISNFSKQADSWGQPCQSGHQVQQLQSKVRQLNHLADDWSGTGHPRSCPEIKQHVQVNAAGFQGCNVIRQGSKVLEGSKSPQCRFPGLQGCRFRELQGARVLDS